MDRTVKPVNGQMKGLLLAMSLLLAEPVMAQMLSYQDLVYRVNVKEARCAIPGLTESLKHWSADSVQRGLEFCVVPGSLIKTAYGARAQFLTASRSQAGTSYYALFREANCISMAERSRELCGIYT